ncbi:hypothetical protein [Adonisia turfae]|uniref:Uncharacterized protein n=1 Tax=Adonisia turfae CCMR0081 TaxID=2292702 RepID=A0A6M0RN88_9CYAN|nr:hypothetical protein [Adonisia turfae]NEZ57636.1 hypothetical protein [Adonisia turfae CCMR0081]
MYEQVVKSKENKNQSVANKVSQKQRGSESTFQFKDIRPEAASLRNFQEIANNSPQANRAVQFFPETCLHQSPLQAKKTPLKSQPSGNRVIQRMSVSIPTSYDDLQNGSKNLQKSFGEEPSHLFDTDLSRLRPDETLTIFSHGSPNDLGGYNASTLANIMLKLGFKGCGMIRIVACSTGINPRGFGQQLATHLHSLLRIQRENFKENPVVPIIPVLAVGGILWNVNDKDWVVIPPNLEADPEVLELQENMKTELAALVGRPDSEEKAEEVKERFQNVIAHLKYRKSRKLVKPARASRSIGYGRKGLQSKPEVEWEDASFNAFTPGISSNSNKPPIDRSQSARKATIIEKIRGYFLKYPPLQRKYAHIVDHIEDLSLSYLYSTGYVLKEQAERYEEIYAQFEACPVLRELFERESTYRYTDTELREYKARIRWAKGIIELEGRYKKIRGLDRELPREVRDICDDLAKLKLLYTLLKKTLPLCDELVWLVLERVVTSELYEVVVIKAYKNEDELNKLKPLVKQTIRLCNMIQNIEGRGTLDGDLDQQFTQLKAELTKRAFNYEALVELELSLRYFQRRVSELRIAQSEVALRRLIQEMARGNRVLLAFYGTELNQLGGMNEGELNDLYGKMSRIEPLQQPLL